MDKHPTIVVVGSCMIDLISYTKRLPRPGETLHGTEFSIGFGGKGANQCVAAARLGASTAMVARVGNDTFGKDYLKNFEENEVCKEHVKVTDDISTGIATIAVDEKGENSILIVAGANLKMTEGDVVEAENLIKTAKVVVCQGEISESATKQALLLGRRHKVVTLMNAAPASSQMIEDIYGLSDIFCVNETEAATLTGMKVNSVSDAQKASEWFIKKGCLDVIITLGAEGALISNATSHLQVPAPKVSSVVDTTGAGDAFVGALAYAIARHSELPLPKMVEKACHIASISVQSKGTQSSFPYKNKLESFEI